MRIVDLSRPIEPAMPVYPGDPEPRIEPAARIDRDGFATELLHIGSHTGTHIAAPAHFVQGGADIAGLALERCVAPGVVLDVRSAGPNGVIGTQRLLEAEAMLGRPVSPGEAVLLHTGASERWDDPSYLTKHPGLDAEGASLIVERGAALVGLDAISVDLPGEVAFPAHRLLLEAGVLIVENLASLEALPRDGFTFVAAPLATAGASGSPVRALAIIL